MRYAEGKVERLAGVAAELVRFKVDVIVVGSTPAVMATKKATDAIPIVMVTTGDPVASGLVVSLARPGGNITGLTALGQELGGKRLEVLKEAIPKVSRVAILSNPVNPDTRLSLQGVEIAARALGVQLRVQEVRDPTEFEKSWCVSKLISSSQPEASGPSGSRECDQDDSHRNDRAPVEAGFVESLAGPGGNVTGLTNLNLELSPGQPLVHDEPEAIYTAAPPQLACPRLHQSIRAKRAWCPSLSRGQVRPWRIASGPIASPECPRPVK